MANVERGAYVSVGLRLDGTRNFSSESEPATVLPADGGGMSDFLSRIVGRSIGPSQGIQPRVPSLYEPLGKGSGPLWARHDFEEEARRTPENEIDAGRALVSEDDSGRPSLFRPMEPSRHARHGQPAAFRLRRSSPTSLRPDRINAAFPARSQPSQAAPSSADRTTRRTSSSMAWTPANAAPAPRPRSTTSRPRCSR